MVLEYPVVVDEFETLRRLHDGFSISRIGDGEFKCIFGAGYAREPKNIRLQTEMYDILVGPHENCLVGIPNMDPKGVKYENWLRHQERYTSILSPDVQYHSAFITRPDNAQWIDNKEFAEDMESLWAGKKVIVVGERKSKLASVASRTAKVRNVECPHREAYSQIDKLEAEVLKKPAELVLLSAGPTATCLAHRLAVRGIQALDLGSVGGFLVRKLYSDNGGAPNV